MKILLGELKGRSDELVSFLEPRIGTKPVLSGDAIEINEGGIRKGIKPRHVKTYIKRFLHINGLRKSYRVLVRGSELTLQRLGEVTEEAGEKKEDSVQQGEVKEEKRRVRRAPTKKKEQK